jgi:caffeoyl-CoA O-methyltransferase
LLVKDASKILFVERMKMAVYTDELSQYVGSVFVRQDETLAQVREMIPQKGLPAIYIQPEEGRFLPILVRAINAERAIEIGSLGGYSGIWIARGLSPGGKLITLEKDPYHAQVAREHFIQAGLADRVEVRQGDAHQLLRTLAAEGPFDFVFIDAEKPGYADYLEWAIPNTRVGGVIAAHNAFQQGEVAHHNPKDNAVLMDTFNRQAAADPRLLSTIFPAGDGTLIAVKVSD